MKPFWHKLFEGLQVSAGVPPAPAPLRALAATLAFFYGLGAWGRRALYRYKILKPKRLPAPVVSVGNLTVGGTGKTPMVACLARLFQGQGKKVAILSRGYRGLARGVTRISDGQEIYQKPPQVGEEAYWLARTLPGVAVYTGASRYKAGMSAWQEFKPDLFLLDDGFQHFQLHRDLDIVLLDAEAPFGNGHLLPRGPLREPLSALTAAQALILTRFQENLHLRRLLALKATFPDKTVLTAAITPAAAHCHPGGQEQPLAALKGRPLYAFAGLARSEVFIDALIDLRVALKGVNAFPDHYPFNHKELQALVKDAQSREAEALITTAKDWARLGETWEADLPLWVLEVEAKLHQPLPEEVMERVMGGGPGA
ncbi:MAG: tetraacyldisaccharide 4'-kinase [Desulfobaccales bacterium]|nr:tetraacyldisaccharide 4'-kinase [Desulfobaccales bacterium]